jgi:HK97 family phage major capsid protein
MIFDPDLKKRNMSKIQEIKDRVEAAGRNMTPDERALVSNLLTEIDENNRLPTREPSKMDPSSGMQVGRNRAGLEPFEGVGDQFQAIARAMVPGGAVDPRLHEINQRAASGLNEGVSSEGGFLVQQDFSDTIMGNVWASEVLSRITRYEVSGNANSMTINGVDESSRADGSRQGGVRGYWVSEAAEITSSKPAFREINLKLGKAAVLIYATEEMLADRAVLGKFIEQAGAAELEFMLTDAIINGDGAGKPLGILNASCRATQDKDSGQTASTITQTNILNAHRRLLPSSLNRAVWLANKDTATELYTLASDSNASNPVFLPQGGLASQPYAKLMGLPLIYVEQCATLGTEGDLILCDLSKYVAISKSQLVGREGIEPSTY